MTDAICEEIRRAMLIPGIEKVDLFVSEGCNELDPYLVWAKTRIVLASTPNI
jgi:hypothetical protein